MGPFHKEVASFLLESGENNALSDKEKVIAIASRTEELISQIMQLVPDHQQLTFDTLQVLYLTFIYLTTTILAV